MDYCRKNSTIIGMLTARYLGPSNYGLLSYASSIVAFVVPIMNLGLNNILVQEVTNNPDEEGRIFGTSLILSVVSAFACIFGVSTYTFLVDANEPTTNWVVILYSVLLIFQALELMQYWFQAKLLSKYMSIASLLAYIFVATYKITLLVKGASIYYFAISNSIDYFLIAIFLILAYKKLGGQHLSFSKDTALRMLSSSKHYIIADLMVTIFAQTDRIMLKLILNEEAVGYYSAAVTCACITSFVFVAIIDSMRPSIFAYKKAGDLERYEKGISRTYCIIIYLALGQCVLMTVFAKIIIVVLYGGAFEPSVITLRIVVWFTTFSYMGAVRNIWILGEGKQKYLWIINFGGAITNIVLNATLIPVFGVNGAAFASLATQFFTNVIMNVIVRPLKYNNHLMWKGLNPNLIIELIKSNR